MNMKEERIKALMLAGSTREHIIRQCPDLTEASTKVYISKVRATLSPEQRDAYDRAQVQVSRAFATQRPLSTAHHRIGQHLARFRIEAKLTPKAFCLRYPFTSHVTLTKLEGGTHDFKFSELQTISEILNMSIDQLSQPQRGPLPHGVRRKAILQPGSDPPLAAEDCSAA